MITNIIFVINIIIIIDSSCSIGNSLVSKGTCIWDKCCVLFFKTHESRVGINSKYQAETIFRLYNKEYTTVETVIFTCKYFKFC